MSKKFSASDFNVADFLNQPPKSSQVKKQDNIKKTSKYKNQSVTQNENKKVKNKTSIQNVKTNNENIDLSKSNGRKIDFNNIITSPNKKEIKDTQINIRIQKSKKIKIESILREQGYSGITDFIDIVFNNIIKKFN